MNNFYHHFSNGAHTIHLTDYYRHNPHAVMIFRDHAEVVQRDTEHHLNMQRFMQHTPYPVAAMEQLNEEGYYR